MYKITTVACFGCRH